MDQIVAFLASLTYWHWLAFGTVLIILEILTPTFYLIWPGIAAIVVGVLHVFVPDISWQASLTIFGLVSVVATVIWHTVYKSGARATHGDGRSLNRRADSYVGRRATVAEGFRNGRGPILLDDSRWEAVSDGQVELAPGSAVEVTGNDGAILRVRPA